MTQRSHVSTFDIAEFLFTFYSLRPLNSIDQVVGYHILEKSTECSKFPKRRRVSMLAYYSVSPSRSYFQCLISANQSKSRGRVASYVTSGHHNWDYQIAYNDSTPDYDYSRLAIMAHHNPERDFPLRNHNASSHATIFRSHKRSSLSSCPSPCPCQGPTLFDFVGPLHVPKIERSNMFATAAKEKEASNLNLPNVFKPRHRSN